MEGQAEALTGTLGQIKQKPTVISGLHIERASNGFTLNYFDSMHSMKREVVVAKSLDEVLEKAKEILSDIPSE